VAGITRIVSGAANDASYDGKLHTIFLGFVMSMVFGHAPIIVPSVLGVAVPYRRVYWVHVVLLHGGLAVRMLGDARPSIDLWQIGGVLNEAAILLFIAVTAIASMQATRARARNRQPRWAGNVEASRPTGLS
jgi:hypothetical protein